ncbi:small integral membrane protein 32 [Centroberyx affinis]|uniref:small integral membrane protein 32 n=1 Tax=Centroberyx affinis TaxID=166261 RepID=UPI003A5C3403
MDCGRSRFEGTDPPPFHSASSPGLEWTEPGRVRNAEPGFRLFQFTCGTLPQRTTNRPTQPVSPRGTMLRQILLNSTDAPDFDLVLMAQSSTHAPASLNASHGGSVSVAALLRPTTGRGGGGLREGELHKPDLATYIVMCLVLFLLVLLIVFFINCQLRNSFFASMPYDRSLREARTSYK